MTHGKHEEASGFAGAVVEQTEEAVNAALLRAEEAIRVTLLAVGQHPIGAGARAYAKVTTIRDALVALVDTCEEAKTELKAYALGW